MYKIVWTPEKKEKAIAILSNYFAKHGIGEMIQQSDDALINAPDVLSEIADNVLIEDEGILFEDAAEVLIADKVDPLDGNEVAPPLVKGNSYQVLRKHVCECGQEHYDVGLVSEYNFIRCYKCEEHLPDGDKVHWCHPSRFINP